MADLYGTHGMQSVSRAARVDASMADFRLGTVSIQKSNLNWIAQTLSTAFDVSGLFDRAIPSASILALVTRFYDEYLPSVPAELKNRHGSTSDGGLLSLWLLLNTIEPECYIESGVFVGASLRLADMALPASRKWAYDLSFRPLLYRQEHISYVQNDWSVESPNIPVGSMRAFAFFDDHIDPVRRIVEAYERGIEWVLFDDSPGFANLHPYSYPAVPSISMILDDAMPDGAIVEWTPPGQTQLLRYTHDKQYCQRAKDLIVGHLDMRALMDKVGLRCGDKAAVRLRKIGASRPLA